MEMESHNLKLLGGLVHLSAIVYILMIVFNALGGIGYEGIVISCYCHANGSIILTFYVSVNQRYFQSEHRTGF